MSAMLAVFLLSALFLSLFVIFAWGIIVDLVTLGILALSDILLLIRRTANLRFFEDE